MICPQVQYPVNWDICILLQTSCSLTNHLDHIYLNSSEVWYIYLYCFRVLAITSVFCLKQKFFRVCCCSRFIDDWPLALGFGLFGQTQRDWKRQSAAEVPLNSESPSFHSSSASSQDGRLAWRSSPCAGHQRQKRFKPIKVMAQQPISNESITRCHGGALLPLQVFPWCRHWGGSCSCLPVLWRTRLAPQRSLCWWAP